MKIGVAQLQPEKGNIPTNIQKHIDFILSAAQLGANSIFFPELSLTSYEPEMAATLATDQNDRRFDIFQELSNSKKIIIGAGIPSKQKTGIMISMVLFRPFAPRLLYSKQQLHADELPYFMGGQMDVMVSTENTKIGLGICYESLLEAHAETAFQAGADLYLASVAKPVHVIDKAYQHYSHMAKKYGKPFLMANCIGYCDHFMSAGKSAVWAKDGTLLAHLDGHSQGIIVYDTATDKITIARVENKGDQK